MDIITIFTGCNLFYYCSN